MLQDVLANEAALPELEQTLYAALNVYTQRLAWLDSGSRRVCVASAARTSDEQQHFGVLTEPKVAVVVDTTHRHLKQLKAVPLCEVTRVMCCRRRWKR